MAASLSLPLGVVAQLTDQYPTRPIQLVISGPTGSIPDIYARRFAIELSSSLGQPVVVDNKPGASGAIALDVLMRARPDGYTIYFGLGGELVLNRLLGGPVKIDPVKDLAPIAAGPAASPTLLVSANSGILSVADLVQVARSNPSSTTCGTAGQATLPHFLCVALARRAGFDVLAVSYKGNSAALIDTAAGHVSFAIGQPSESWPLIADRRLRPLAVFGNRRIALWPDVPRLAELGLDGLEVRAWTGFFAPAGTPAGIVERLNKDLNRAVSNTELGRQIAQAGGEFDPMAPAAFSEFISRDTARWRTTIEEMGLRVQ